MFGQYEYFDPGMFDPGVYFPLDSGFDWSQITGGEWMGYTGADIFMDGTPPPTPLPPGYVYPSGISAGIVPSSGGGIIQSVLGAGASIAAALLAPKAPTPTTAPRPTTTMVAQKPSILSGIGSSLPLLGAVGLGAYFLLRKKKGK